MLRILGILTVIGTAPMVWWLILALAERDYVAGLLLVLALASLAHLGVELLALSQEQKES